MTTTPRSLPLVALVLAFAVIGVNVRLVAGGKTWADPRYHTEVAPPRLAAADAVQRGIVPGWWDGTGLGVPLAAEPLHGALYPPTWLAATPSALDLLGILHLVWAALGVAVWARRRAASWAPNGASEPAAVVAGLLVVTSGLFAGMAVRGALPALAHLPWLGVAAASLREATDRRERTGAAILLGVLLGLVGLSGVFAGLVDATVLVIALAARRRVAGYLIAAVVGGLAIGAVQWLPAILQLGAEAGAQIGGLPFARLVELIVPGSFGALDPDRAITAIAGDAAWAPSVFVGAPLLALSAVRPPARRLLGVILMLATFTLVVGRGGWPSWLGAPELHLAALVIVLGPRAAAGLDALVAGERRAMIALCVGGACAGVALGALGALRSRHPEAAPAIDRALLDGGLGLVCIAAALSLVWRAPGRAMPVLLALLVLPSVGAAPSLAPVIDRSIVDEPGVWAQAARAQSRSPAPIRMYRPEFMFDGAALARGPVTLERTPGMPALRSEPETVEDSISTFAGASAWKWGIAAARSEDPARPVVHDRVWLAAAQGGGVLLDRFGISVAILPETMVVALDLTPLGHHGGWVLAPLPVAPPAAVMRGWAWAVAPEDAVALMFPMGGRATQIRGTTVLRGGGPSQPDRGPPLPCTVERWDPGDLELACTSEVDGYAVVSSTPSTGWTVTVDDREAPWLTADVLRRAVAMPAGAHHVRWRYHPPGFGAGFAIAAIGAALLLALGLASRLGRS
ncbi:MAG: hypothetical protein H6Q90_5696 [Deltaproteobacteria bacterium]|nr:hypothetical protein [Deltaproteobacteria bacterium]